MTKSEFVAIIKELIAAADDETAVKAQALYPEWQAGEALVAGMRVMHDGTLYTITQSHYSQADWTPDAASSLFAEVLPGQAGTEIGEWAQPDSTDAYMTGDRVTYNGKTYESTVDYNVWSPGVYGWREVTA